LLNRIKKRLPIQTRGEAAQSCLAATEN